MNPPDWFVPGAIALLLWLGSLRWLPGLSCLESRSSSKNCNQHPPWLAGASAVISLFFLLATVRSGAIQDYYFYLKIWHEVRLGRDPWFLIQGIFGVYPLNAYGPLFNLLAIPAGGHPLLPKLLFATSYVLIAYRLTDVAANPRRVSGVRSILLLAWFWNPFVWVEIAHYGHFDVLVGLSCVAAAALHRGRRAPVAGVALGLGVLLKYMPIVLMPFMILDQVRIRWRFFLPATAVIVLGMVSSLLWWGTSVLRPLTFAASRRAFHLSIYRFLSSGYLAWSPAAPFQPYHIEPWAPLILFLALLRTWSWHRQRRIAAEPAMVIGLFVTVLFYQVGFSQYQMVPFVMGSWWLVHSFDDIPFRLPVVMALGCYFGWLSAFVLLDAFIGVDSLSIQAWAGLPTFVLGITLVTCLVVSARRMPPS